MKANLLLSALLMLAFGASSSDGQVRQLDYSKRLSEMESKEYETPMKDFEVSEELMSKRFATNEYDTEESRYQGKMARFQKDEAMEKDMYPAEELSFEKLERKEYRKADQMFSNDQLEEIRYNTLHHKFNDRHSDLLDENKEQFKDRLGDLSLADLNRFQFRRSHSDEPGLPVTEAAGGEEPQRSREFSGGEPRNPEPTVE